MQLKVGDYIYHKGGPDCYAIITLVTIKDTTYEVIAYTSDQYGALGPRYCCPVGSNHIRLMTKDDEDELVRLLLAGRKCG